MSERLSIQVDTRQTADVIAIAQGVPTMRRAIVVGLRKAMASVEQVHKREVMGRGMGPKFGGVWSMRTGEASRSFHRVIDDKELEGAYGSELRRVGIIELGSQEAIGGPIRPRNGKYLAIPTDNAKVGVGAAPWPRNRTDLVFVQSLKGQPMLVRPRAGEKGGFDVMYILRRQVTVPPHPTLPLTIQRSQPKVDAAMLEAVTNALTPKGGANA
jgi:hypothetical protein